MKKVFFLTALVMALFAGFGLQQALTQDAPSGEALVNERCTQCHDLMRVNRVKTTKDAAGWERTVDRMISKRDGLLNDAERAAVLEYLIQD